MPGTKVGGVSIGVGGDDRADVVAPERRNFGSRCGMDISDEDKVAIDILSIRPDEAAESKSEKFRVELVRAYNPVGPFLGTSAAVDAEGDVQDDKGGYHGNISLPPTNLRRSSRENATTVSGTGYGFEQGQRRFGRRE